MVGRSSLESSNRSHAALHQHAHFTAAQGWSSGSSTVDFKTYAFNDATVVWRMQLVWIRSLTSSIEDMLSYAPNLHAISYSGLIPEYINLIKESLNREASESADYLPAVLRVTARLCFEAETSFPCRVGVGCFGVDVFVLCSSIFFQLLCT
jgi:hypothetical protein